MKTKMAKGFTLVELLVVLAIVAMLIGLLMPALSEVRKYAGTVKQKSQIGSIEIALNLYKNDFGQYPRSNGYDPVYKDADSNTLDYPYSGAQTLAEAMVGYDLLGVHPNTVYRSDGYDITGNANEKIYPTPSATEPNSTNLGQRKGPYLDRTNIGVFGPNDVYTPTELTSTIKKYGHLICDTFATQSTMINGKRYKIGTPILYFRANTSAVNPQLNLYSGGTRFGRYAWNIYNYSDNYWLMWAAYNKNNKNSNFYNTPDGTSFYNYISDPMIPAATGTCGRPQKPDSFILISAGPDGLYGTKDDICNFEPNIK
jgi:prepilin-type N-terminal cleavage/methylation domain-containing protein